MEKKDSFERLEEMEIDSVRSSVNRIENKNHILKNLDYVRNSGAVVESFFSTTIKLFVSLFGGKK